MTTDARRESNRRSQRAARARCKAGRFASGHLDLPDAVVDGLVDRGLLASWQVDDAGEVDRALATFLRDELTPD